MSDDVRGDVEDLDDGASLQTVAYEEATPRQQVKFLLKLVQNNIINITSTIVMSVTSYSASLMFRLCVSLTATCYCRIL